MLHEQTISSLVSTLALSIQDQLSQNLMGNTKQIQNMEKMMKLNRKSRLKLKLF